MIVRVDQAHRVIQGSIEHPLGNKELPRSHPGQRRDKSAR
jgi:hypothetical protein